MNSKDYIAIAIAEMSAKLVCIENKLKDEILLASLVVHIAHE